MKVMKEWNGSILILASRIFGTDIEEMLSMTKDDIVSKLKEIAAEYSNDKITIIIREDSVSFEKMDERSGEFD